MRMRYSPPRLQRAHERTDDGLLFRDGQWMRLSAATTTSRVNRPVWAFLGIRPGAGQRAHCVILLHSCKALIMSACSCACSDFARSEQAVS